MTTPEPSATPVFDPGAAHQQRPKLRAIRGFPARMGEQMVLGLADARQISDKVVFVPPAVQAILPHMNGERTLDEIVGAVGRGLTRPILEGFIAQLDEAGLLFGPVFETMQAKMRQEFDSSSVLPPATSAAFLDSVVGQTLGENATQQERDAAVKEHGPGKLREVFDQWMNQTLEKAEKPSFDELPKAVVVPHVDYPRGWLNYAAAWGRMRVVDRPDRVIILGTNHFGEGTGVVGCDKGYQTPLGVCELDREFVATLRRRLGEEQTGRLFANRYDHEREHSIELQIAWVQHCLGKDEAGNFCKVFGALVHDPTVSNGESYDGRGLGFNPFVEAMKAAIAEMPGRTLVVSSADLSHMGPAFGDQQALAGDAAEAEQARNKIFQHDREMLQLLAEKKTDELIAAMSWQQNPTRWCSIGNMVAAVRIVEPTSIRILNYAAAMDQEGMGLVSSASMVMN
ncbi:MAG: AmmeMemoRadiSam system protein B [Phycisphaerales bacterium]|nr:AmmeMemoRadiSam system protein B [Phycisphaerales bacterium]